MCECKYSKLDKLDINLTTGNEVWNATMTSDLAYSFAGCKSFGGYLEALVEAEGWNFEKFLSIMSISRYIFNSPPCIFSNNNGIGVSHLSHVNKFVYIVYYIEKFSM